MKLLDVFNENNEYLGYSVERLKVHEENLWHHHVSAWIMNYDGKILLQQRALNKKKNPGKWAKTGELKLKSDVGLSMRDSGEDAYACIDLSNAKAPTQRCLTENHIMIDGECADGPKPMINGGCEPGDYLVGGGCYTKDDKDQWVCL